MDRPLRCVHKDDDQSYRHSELAQLRPWLIFLVVRVSVVLCHDKNHVTKRKSHASLAGKLHPLALRSPQGTKRDPKSPPPLLA